MPLVGDPSTGGPVKQITDGQAAELDALYAQVPEGHCRGLCAASACGPIGMGDGEYARLQGAGQPPIPRADIVGQLGYTCPALDAMGRCSVYQLRPMVCRLWGAVEDMPCRFGCVPDGGLLPAARGHVLLIQATMVGASGPARRRGEQTIGRLSGAGDGFQRPA